MVCLPDADDRGSRKVAPAAVNGIETHAVVQAMPPFRAVNIGGEAVEPGSASPG